MKLSCSIYKVNVVIKYIIVDQLLEIYSNLCFNYSNFVFWFLFTDKIPVHYCSLLPFRIFMDDILNFSWLVCQTQYKFLKQMIPHRMLRALQRLKLLVFMYFSEHWCQRINQTSSWALTASFLVLQVQKEIYSFQ